MAYIKTLKDNELIGGQDNTDVYPITSTQAVYSQKKNGSAPEGKKVLLEERLTDIENQIDTPVGTDDIVDGAVVTRKIADNAITTDKIADSAVTEDKLADGAITSDKIADDVITDLQTIMDEVPTKDSVKPVMSGGVKTAIDNVAFASGEKVNEVGVDSEPTVGSENLVKSGGIYLKINQEKQRAETSEQHLQESVDSIKEETLEENREMVNSVLENYAPVEITGDVTNAADEEDLTSINVEGTDVLKFKDKVYNPLVYSGLGRKVLRKNIVDGVNTLTQSMLNQSNTIYVIQYDFTLAEDITVPNNCVLEFNGGSFRNRTIVGNNTMITTNSDNAIFNNITGISGTFDYTFKPEHFAYGLSGDCFDVALAYLKTNAAFLEIDTIRLKANLDLKGVWFKAKEIQLNAHDLYLGGGEHQFHDKPSEGVSNYNQYIDFITADRGTKSGNVIIEKCYSIKLYIGHREGDIIFQTNTNNVAIAYSEFTIKNALRLVFRTSDGYNKGWINENRFVLQRIKDFVVENSLWAFNHNFIYGGCFEGPYTMRLEVGTGNHFYDIRNEGSRTINSTLYFGLRTKGNVYETQEASNGYIYDYGSENVIIADNAFYADTKLHETYSVEDAIDNLPTRFKALSVVDESTAEYPNLKYLKPDSGTAVVYTSPFLKVESNLTNYNILEITALNEPYLYFNYSFYDENLNKVPYPAGVTTGGLIVTNSGSYMRNGEGTYGVDCNHNYNSQFVVSNYRTVFRYTTRYIYGAASTNPECAEWIKKVRYYKVFIQGSDYFHSNTSKILTINFKLLSNHLPIYPITSNLTPSIYFELTNLSYSKDLYLATYGENFEAIIVPNEGYDLPTSIPTDNLDNYVMSGETKLVQGTDFDWDAQTGKISINNVTKPYVIHLTGNILP